tara:strand:- start:1313 stop:1612 length:300 start_codon:yes stop_codon:yes gene_type:complete
MSKSTYSVIDQTLIHNVKHLGEIANINDAPVFILELSKRNPYYAGAEIIAFDIDGEHDAGDIALSVQNNSDIVLIVIERKQLDTAKRAYVEALNASRQS